MIAPRQIPLDPFPYFVAQVRQSPHRIQLDGMVPLIKQTVPSQGQTSLIQTHGIAHPGLPARWDKPPTEAARQS